jgi:hypothetical protein
MFVAENSDYILLRLDGQVPTNTQISSRTGFFATPTLVVTYSVPEPVSAGLTLLAIGGLLARHRRR